MTHFLSASPEQRLVLNRGPRQAEQHARAQLWTAVWEASQFCDYDEIRRIVEATLREIVSDEP